MKKLISILLSAVMLVSVLSGCSGSNGSAPASSAGGSSQAPVQSAPPEESSGQEELSRKAYEGTTLNILLKTGYETAAITEFQSDFEDATGISLNVEIYDEPTLRNKFILDCNSKLGNYDVVATQFWYMPEYIKTGWLEPLDSFHETQSDPEWNSISNTPESALGMFKDADGKLYSICVSCTGGVLIYRKDLFEKHGIAAPKTTEDVMAAAKVLKEKEPDIYPFVARGDSSSGSFGTSAGWAWAYGASVLTPDGKVTCNTPEMKSAMTDFVQLMSEFAPSDSAAMGWDTMSELFRQGKAAMNFDMNGFVSTYTSKDVSTVADQIDCTVITGPSGSAAQWMYGEGLGISSFSKNKEAAWLFLQWRNSLDVIQKELDSDIRFDFPDTRIYETESYKAKTQDIGFFTEKLPEIMNSIDSVYWPATESFEKVAEAYQQQISLAIAGDVTVDQALENAQSAVEAVMK